MRLLALFLAGFAISSNAWTCSMSFIPISVGRSFQVKVSSYDGPVKGLLLNLKDSEGRTQSSAITSRDGIAEFYISELYIVASGPHFLEADHDNGYGLQLDVKPNGPANVTVPMKWPSKEPILVRSLSGTMRAPDAIPGQLEQPVLSLDLLEGVSGRVLSSVSTTSRGEFDFGRLTPGLYFIRLKPYLAFNQRQQVGGLISVAVDPGASAENLDLNLTWSSCGLSYTDPRQCPYPDLHVKRLEGRVTDSMGRAVRYAVIVLLDAARNPVAHVSTDPNGNFSYPGALEGTLELWIDGGNGFNPVHTPIHIEPGARGSSLEIDAAYGEICSGVWVK